MLNFSECHAIAEPVSFNYTCRVERQKEVIDQMAIVQESEKA